MAEFEYDAQAISKLIDNLSKANLYNDENERKLVDVGSSEVLESIQTEMGRSSFDISKFRSKIKKSSKAKRDKNGNMSVTISPQGNYTGNGKPRRLAAILFVLNYGRRKQYGEITGDYFWTNGVRKGQTRAEEAMREEVEKIYHERGLI